MAFHIPITIMTALRSIEERKYVLPDIQREVVWSTDQIERLFDSLMRGYPIGSFLFWKVQRDIMKYRFYDFMLHYHEKDNRRLQRTGRITREQIVAVLDGQQRLTALNIGLRGSYAYKLPYYSAKSDHAYPERHLYLNILADAEENEDGLKYDFQFLTEDEAKDNDKTHHWYRVRDILSARGIDLHRFLIERNLGDESQALDVLDGLHRMVHTNPVIAYYEEEGQDVGKVLDIFVRTNSGGTPLSNSDILMSISIAQWTRDAREAIHSTVDQINRLGDGFNFSRDFVLKAGLMLAGIQSVGFRVTNFNTRNMQRLEERWDHITHAIVTAVGLIVDFGFSRQSLTADNAVLPIAHYVYQRKMSGDLHREDREAIRSWLIRSLLKRGIWGAGLDTLLTRLRSVIDEHGSEAFPVARMEEAMRDQGKILTFVDEELQDLAESGDRTFGLLSLLYPFVDLRNNHFHIDHVFPKSRFSPSKLRRAGVAEDDIETFQDCANRLPNLQLLAGNENQSKRDKMPTEWISSAFDSKAKAIEYVSLHDLGNLEEIPEDIPGFIVFYEARRDRILAKLRNLLGSST